MNPFALPLLLPPLVALQGCASMQQPTSDCPSSTTNASYTGPYKGMENQVGAADMARDFYCADRFKAAKYPQGFVAIYGSSRYVEQRGQLA